MLLGVHKSSLNRSILHLKKTGAIKAFTKNTVSILDEEKLLAIANGVL